MADNIPRGDEIAVRDNEERATAIFRLAAILQGQGFTLALNKDDPELDITHDGGHLATVACRPRASDSGRLWFFEPPSTPICEADNLADAAVWVKGRAFGNP